MLLKSLTLHNFKRFRQQEIRFSEGVTGIIGNNGTGKSSIVEGILFALYGLSGTGIKGEFIVSSFANPRERCEVRLDFRIRGQTYTIRRAFRKGLTTQHEAWLNRDEKLLAQGVTDVDREITRILGMNAIDLKNTIYAGQKDLIALLESRPGERKEWFSRILGIDYLKEESLTILKERVDRAERKESLLEGELSTLLHLIEEEDIERLGSSRWELENTVFQQQEAVVILHADIRKREEDLNDLQQEKFRFTRLMEQKNALEREIDALLRRKTSLSDEISALESQAKEYEQLHAEMKDYPKCKERYELERQKKTRFDLLMQEKAFIKRRYKDLEKRQERLFAREKECRERTQELAFLRERVRKDSGCHSDIGDASLERWIQEKERILSQQIGALNEILEGCGGERERVLLEWDSLRQAGSDGICPLCHQRLGEYYHYLEHEFESRLHDIVTRAEKACEILEEHEKVRSILSNLRPQLAAIRSLGDLDKELGSLTQDHQFLEEEKTQVLGECNHIDHQIGDLAFNQDSFSLLEHQVASNESRYQYFLEMGKLIATLPVLLRQKEEILIDEKDKRIAYDQHCQELNKSSYCPAEEERLQTELVYLREECTKQETAIARNQERLAKILEHLNRLQEIQRRIEEVEQQKSDLLEDVRLLRLTRSAVSDFVIYLMQVVRGQIEQTAGEILSTITDERYDRVLLDNDFNLRISDMNTDYPIERFSGGEQDDIAVALRIALSRYLSELHQTHESTFLIFDEIFGSQDEERRNNLLRALRTQESYFPQIILISHIPDIQGEFGTTLMVERESDQISVVREGS